MSSVTLVRLLLSGEYCCDAALAVSNFVNDIHVLQRKPLVGESEGMSVRPFLQIKRLCVSMSRVLGNRILTSCAPKIHVYM